MRNFVAAAALGLSALALTGCATGGLPATVTRFQAMPATQGQSFAVVADNPAMQNTLEFERYAALVDKAMREEGYAKAASPASATMLVKLGYGVDEGEYEYYRDPLYDPFYDPFYGRRGYGAIASRYPPRYNPYYSRYGSYYGRPSPYYYGWNDPFMCTFDCGSLNRVKVHKSFVDVDIRRRTDDKQLFDGRAMARSRTGDLSRLVPNLVSAVFHDFPGKSGETVRITVAEPKTR